MPNADNNPIPDVDHSSIGTYEYVLGNVVGDTTLYFGALSQ
jgi:hypothetical protein